MILTGCRDDLLDGGFSGDYPEGETLVNFNIDYEPFSGQNLDTRGIPGKTMDKLDDLTLVAYDRYGNLMDGFPVEITPKDHGLVVTNQKRDPENASNGQLGEKETKRANFAMQLPYGSYYIYAVSNIGSRNNSGELVVSSYSMLTSDKMKEIVATREKLLDYATEWDETNPYNNFQMFGYFCNDALERAPHTATGANDVKVSIDRSGLTIHSWMRRSCSKVTIDINGEELSNNVVVRIRRATIHDIPTTCKLGRPNTPASISQLYSYKDNKYRPTRLNTGNQISYTSSTDHTQWPMITKDKPTFLTNPHEENAESLFLYENMQGDSEDKENKLQKPTPEGFVSGASEMKDLMPYGSYIEVEGYYSYSAAGEAHEGPIYYRFMLGKNVTNNFDVERNYHLKLTMKLRGRGNDVDWHIEYDRNNGFEWKDPYYVSYLYNQSSTIHFRYTPDEGKEVDHIDAQIICNGWWADDNSDGGRFVTAYNEQYPFVGEPNMVNNTFTWKQGILYGQNNVAEDKAYLGAQYEKVVGKPKFIGNGFLSLFADDQVVENFERMNGNGMPTVVQSGWTGNDCNKYINDRLFYGLTNNEDQSFRRFYVTNKGSFIQDTDDEREKYTVDESDDHSLRVNIPVFTRPKNLLKVSGYGGNNPNEGSERTAYILFSVYYKGNNTSTPDGKQIMRVKQVRRLTNPTGIYRSYNNNEGFSVELVHKETPVASAFTSFNSDGPWMAEVLGSSNFITLNGRTTVSGNDGTPIKFDVRFNRMNQNKTIRNAIIRIRYHNYTCVHLIFVRQGYGSQQLKEGGAEWHTLNMIHENLEASDPRDEGSLFKYGAWDMGIDVMSNGLNWAYNSPLLDAGTFKSKATPAANSLYLATATGDVVRNANGTPKGYSWTDFYGTMNGYTGQKIGLPSITNMKQLFANSELYPSTIKHAFGVLYADGATTVQKEYKDAFNYNRHDAGTEKRGMRGLFVYNWDDSRSSSNTFNFRNVFFPIGRAGFGNRRSNDAGDGNVWNSVHGTLRYAAGRDGEMPNSISPFQPLFYDLYRREGAIYWAALPDDRVQDVANDIIDNALGLDINYYTFDVNILPKGNLQKCSLWNGCDHYQCINALFARKVGSLTEPDKEPVYSRKKVGTLSAGSSVGKKSGQNKSRR